MNHNWRHFLSILCYQKPFHYVLYIIRPVYHKYNNLHSTWAQYGDFLALTILLSSLFPPPNYSYYCPHHSSHVLSSSVVKHNSLLQQRTLKLQHSAHGPRLSAQLHSSALLYTKTRSLLKKTQSSSWTPTSQRPNVTSRMKTPKMLNKYNNNCNKNNIDEKLRRSTTTW